MWTSFFLVVNAIFSLVSFLFFPHFYSLLGENYGVTVWKVSKYGVIFGPRFPVLGPGKTPYLHTFHAVRSAEFSKLGGF